MRASLEDNMVGESTQKEKLFRLLESYFFSAEETSEVNELYALFKLAKDSHTGDSPTMLSSRLALIVLAQFHGQ